MKTDGAGRLRDVSTRLTELEGQVRELRNLVHRFILAGAVAGLLLSLLIPFLSSKDDDLYLLQAVFALADEGRGSRQGSAMFASLTVTVLVALTIATGVALACVMSALDSQRARRVAAILAGFLLAGCCCGWLLVLVLNTIWDGNVGAFSPAMASMTFGAVLALSVTGTDRQRSARRHHSDLYSHV